MRIDELCSKLGKSRSTVEKRIKKLTPEQIGVIRVSVSNGKLHHYEYNDQALSMLQNVQSVQSVNEKTTKVDKLELELSFANNMIKQLKEENQYLKDQVQQIQQHQNNIELAYVDSTKYIQSLLENQQKITMDLQQKIKLIEAPAPKKKGWFK